ncbi:MAG TPA: MFS transporter, partial [Alcanivorax sp.]|nr:MFS transporter [Alcanivorax sp.]
IAWVHKQFEASLGGQGQALYSSLGFGAGWAAGAGLSGLLWQQWGVDLFFGAALAAVLAAILLIVGGVTRSRDSAA